MWVLFRVGCVLISRQCIVSALGCSTVDATAPGSDARRSAMNAKLEIREAVLVALELLQSSFGD